MTAQEYANFLLEERDYPRDLSEHEFGQACAGADQAISFLTECVYRRRGGLNRAYKNFESIIALSNSITDMLQVVLDVQKAVQTQQ